MAFDIAVPVEADANHVADTHLRAMDSNLLMCAKFPNPQSRDFFREWLRRDTLSHIADNTRRCILVARDPETGAIASFVKWLVHRPDRSQADEAEDERWPETCRTEYLESYASITQEARNRVMGNSQYYHVTFLCTDPDWNGRGAASSLLRHVLAKAEAEGMPVLLESTMPAVTFYGRLGFEVRKEIEMMLPEQGSDEPTELYAEKVMVWTGS